jgi:hypothetical protein
MTVFLKGHGVSVSLLHACNLLATTGLTSEKLSFQAFLQSLSEECFENRFMQERD